MNNTDDTYTGSYTHCTFAALTTSALFPAVSYMSAHKHVQHELGTLIQGGLHVSADACNACSKLLD